MKKILAVMTVLAFWVSVSAPVWAAHPKHGAKTTVASGKHKEPGKKEAKAKAGEKTAEIPPAPAPTPEKHWWKFW